MSAVSHAFMTYAQANANRLLEEIRTVVELESPTTDKAAVDTLVDHLQGRLSGLTGALERLPQAAVGDHLRFRWGGTGPGILVLCHIDTVWPLGELARRPYRVEEGRAYGPGIYDMKGGACIALAAIRGLQETATLPRLPITLLLTSDEETGSATSRAMIEAEARQARYVLVLEPGNLPDGAVKTARKGWGGFTVKVKGRAAHAGGDHEKGRNAIAELSRQILRIEAMTDYATGTTFNVGVVSGGFRPNVVAPEATAQVDLRMTAMAEGERAVAAMMALTPSAEGFTVEVTGGLDRPPYERTPAVVALYERAKAMAAEMGFGLPEIGVGGVSDGNIAAAVGATCLDGLGVVGDGAHAVHEHLVIDFLPGRLALMMRLLADLD